MRRIPRAGINELRNSRFDSESDADNKSGWEVVYTGFILILLSFFIMLCSFSSVEGSKVMKFVASFVDALSVMSGGGKVEKGDVVLHLSAEIVDKRSDLADLYKEIGKLVREYELNVKVIITEKDIRMRMNDTALFEQGVAEISPKSYPILDEIASMIRNENFKVRIEGHTDNLPIHNGRFPSNWELSTTRAVNVLRYLEETANIPRERLSAVGFGEYAPIFPNNNPERMAKNRRVEIVFEKKNGPDQPEDGK